MRTTDNGRHSLRVKNHTGIREIRDEIREHGHEIRKHSAHGVNMGQ